jgi:hypothetical protein
MPVAPSSAAMVSCPSALQTSGAAAAASGDREECLQQQAGTAGITLRRPRQLQPAGRPDAVGAAARWQRLLPIIFSVCPCPLRASPHACRSRIPQLPTSQRNSIPKHSTAGAPQATPRRRGHADARGTPPQRDSRAQPPHPTRIAWPACVCARGFRPPVRVAAQVAGVAHPPELEVDIPEQTRIDSDSLVRRAGDSVGTPGAVPPGRDRAVTARIFRCSGRVCPVP